MVSVTFGPYTDQFGTGFIYDVVGSLMGDDQVTTSSTQITCTQDPSGRDVVIAMTGTNVNSGGTVTDISLSVGGQNELTISGLSLSASDIQAILQETDYSQTRLVDLANLFAGIAWQVDLMSSTVGNLVFGTGANDTVTLGSGADLLMIDGGTDSLNAGGGNDFIYAKNLLGYAASGLTSVDGGDGSDTFALDLRELGDDTIAFFDTGQTVDLTDVFVMGNVIVQLANVENLRGSEFNDKLLGSNSANRLDGMEGNDTLTGRDGADRLIGGAGNDKLVGGDGLDQLSGGDGNDTLVGGDGVDQLSGGVGNDTLTGGAAADHLTGGKGEDHFVYLIVADSAKEHDIIADFHHRQDDIDLTKLHPDTKTDKFTFIGDHKFSHHAGELQVIEHDNSGTKDDFTMVMADLDGNGRAELQIELTGLLNINANDFLL